MQSTGATQPVVHSVTGAGLQKINTMRLRLICCAIVLLVAGSRASAQVMQQKPV